MVYLSGRDAVDARLKCIKPTKEMYRIPDIFSNKGKWKGADWLWWALFYEIPCLDGLVKDDILKNFLILNNCIFTLLSDSIDVFELDECEENLIKFTEECQRKFGISFMTSNIHALTHDVMSVKKCGPLWATSGFSFQSKLVQIKKTVKGPTKVAEQVADACTE